GDAATQQDYDILLMVEYPILAALDGLRDKTDPIGANMDGSEDQQRQLAVKRLEIREIMGDKTMRAITLKEFLDVLPSRKSGKAESPVRADVRFNERVS